MLKFQIIKGFSYFLNFLPNAVVLFFGDLIGTLWFYFIPLRRKTVIDNLTLAFGEEKSVGEIEALAANNLRHIGRVLLESVRSIVWTKEHFRRHVPVDGLEHIDPYLKLNQGGFLVSLHLGCWELAPGAGSSHGVPVDVVAKYARKSGMEPFMEWFRKRLGVGVIAETRSTPQILDAISRGRWIGFMMDQFMGPPVGVPVSFFGKTAGTTGSLAALSERHGIACLLAYTYRGSNGKVRTVIEPLKFPEFSADFTERVWQKTQFLNDVLERKVRQYPSQWMWLHRRWKAFQGTSKWDLSMTRPLNVTT